MSILTRTGRALQAYLAAYPQASDDMRRGMETTMLFLACVLENTTQHNLLLLMQQQETEFAAEKSELLTDSYLLRERVQELARKLGKHREREHHLETEVIQLRNHIKLVTQQKVDLENRADALRINYERMRLDLMLRWGEGLQSSWGQEQSKAA